MEQSVIARRGISRTWGVTMKEGKAPHLRVGQVLKPGLWKEYDPFLFLAEDWFEQGTFDFHPHRGIETVTYVIEGKLKHEDNYGGYGVLEPGDVQWMTAGRGIIHSEDPLPGETVHSLQLWVNLARSDKMAEPRYQDIKAENAPLREEEGAVVRVFSGASGGVQAPTLNHIPVTYVEMRMEADAILSQDLPGSYNGFIYVLEGKGRFGVNEVAGSEREVLWLGAVEGAEASEITVRADEALRLILVAGQPIHEPVVAYGPFVMNIDEEIREAFEDYRSGKFGPIPDGMK
ncbi:MAG: pirin [Paenibacillus sp.]|jgi:redox-sensitive bicupin YhaK (pirin superfamily)|nr:pirin [Paenibacillus sp.]